MPREQVHHKSMCSSSLFYSKKHVIHKQKKHKKFQYHTMMKKKVIRYTSAVDVRNLTDFDENLCFSCFTTRGTSSKLEA